MLAGSTLVCSNAHDAGQTLDLLEAERPTITNGFAAGIAHLARHPSFGRRDLSSMRRGNLYPIMAPEVRPADPELRHNMLGLTEAGSVILISGDDSDQPEHRRGSFGKPAPGLETKIVDPETGALVEDGALGELCIRGPCLMQRYYKRSREECFDADGWFHTGDLVATDRDGFVYYIRRRGSMIKTAGANVSPAEVEQAIAKVTGGAVAHVLGIPDAERGRSSLPSSRWTTARTSTRPHFGAARGGTLGVQDPETVRGHTGGGGSAIGQRQSRYAAIEAAVRCLNRSTGW